MGLTPGLTELTGEQQRVVDHDGGLLRVVGAAGTGRTTALLARYLGLVGRHRPSSVLVLCRTRDAADRFLDSALPHLAGGFDSIPVTTLAGVGYDVLARGGRRPRLLTGAERRRTVARLLAGEDPASWPTLGHLLHRPAFAAEVAVALDHLRGAGPYVRPDGPWSELAAFARRYDAALEAEGTVDHTGLLCQATAGLPPPGRFSHLLVDDVDQARPGAAGLLAALARHAADVVVATGPGASAEAAGATEAAEVTLTRPFRRPRPPSLVTCGHPSLEAEAVAAELWAARAAGGGWSQMAVLVRQWGRRSAAVARALARHGIPAAAAPSALGDDPVVRSVVDMLRWVHGDDTALDRLLTSPLSGLGAAEARRARQRARATGVTLEHDRAVAPLVALRDHLAALAPGRSPAELAFETWQRGLAHLAADGHPLDSLVAFVDELDRRASSGPAMVLDDVLAVLDDGEPAARGSAGDDAVTVMSIGAAAGREWDTVVVAGCVEGELPRLDDRVPLFDPALLVGDRPPTAAERRLSALAEERRLFALACSRATGQVIATAGPEPGVLVSRFVEGWPGRDPAPLPVAGRPPVALPGTVSDVGVVGDGGLVLSATQLEVYDDCPLRYAYQYVVRVRDEAGVHADLGSLVHGVLAGFLDPSRPPAVPRTREGLLALAEKRWRDDIARWRPQVEEARRDYFAMLGAWWEAEGEGPGAPEVLAVERRFDVPVGGHRLTGIIDRIDRAEGGRGIRIVDYKTGKAEPSRAATADNLQLAVYHLAAVRDPALAALGPPAQLRLLYLRTMNAYEQVAGPGHEEATEARVLELAERIRAEEFDPAVTANCRRCSFHRLCPLQPEGRQVAGVPAR